MSRVPRGGPAPALLLRLVAFAVPLALLACATRVTSPTPTPVSTTPAVAATPTATSTATASPSPTGTAVPTTAGPGPRRGGVLKLVQPGDPTSCDLASFRGRDFRSVHACNPMFNQLLRFDPQDHGRVLPDLAAAWRTTDGGTTWVFDLEREVRWHDGAPFTAADVVFTYQRVLDPPPGFELGRASPLADYIASVEAPDPHTVVVRTRGRAASFLLNVANVHASIYPRHILQGRDPPTMDAFDQVVGTGPFRPKSFTRDAVYQLQRWEGYFRPDRPYLDEVWYVSIPNDATRFAAFKSREVDVLPVGITQGQADELRRDLAGQVTIHEVATANFLLIALNTRRPPFDDPRVRQAVNLAVDRAEAVAAMGGGAPGAYLPPSGAWALPPARLAALPGLGNKEEERARARQLLADAGYPDGLKVPVLGRTGAFFQTIAALVQGQLATVGIQGELESLDTAAYFDRLARRDFAVTASVTSLVLDDPDEAFGIRYLCDAPENEAGLCDPALDELFRRQQGELAPLARRELVAQMQERLWEHHAYIVGMWTLRRSPYWNDVHGFTMGASNVQGMRLEDVWKER